MRKIVLTFIFIGGLMASANSQTSFGVKGGLNIASLVGDGVENLSVRTSVHFTGMAEFELTDKFSIQPEIMYSAQGAKETLGDYEAMWYLNYINVPLIAKYYIGERLSIEAGPYVGFLVNAKLDWSDNEDAGLDELEELTASIDFGINLGLGYKLESGLNFGARYNIGMVNVLESELYDGTLTNGVFQISIGYYFK